MNRVLPIFIVVMLVIQPAVLLGQQVAEPAGSSRLILRDVAQLDAGQHVRLTVAGARFVGTFRSATGENLSLAMDSEIRTVEFISVDTLWIRGRSTGTGALLGAAFLGVGSALVVGWFAQGLCDSGAFEDAFRDGLRVGLLPAYRRARSSGRESVCWYRAGTVNFRRMKQPPSAFTNSSCALLRPWSLVCMPKDVRVCNRPFLPNAAA